MFNSLAVLGGLETTASRSGFEENSLINILGTVGGLLMSFVGVLFLAMLIVGGVMWMTAGGNVERTKKARNLIVAATLGIIIVAAAFAVTAWLGTNVNPN